MKTYKNFVDIVSFICILLYLTSCEDNNETQLSGRLLDVTEDVLLGDSIYMTVEIDGGNPPFAFRYSYLAYFSSTDSYTKVYKNVLGINERNHTFSVYASDTTTFMAESVATYYQNVGKAVGSATYNIIPVDYIYEETISATKTGFIQKSINALNFSQERLQLQNNTANFTRTIYFEFDANDIQNVQNKSRYILKFWLVSSHTTGVNKSALMEVKGKLGSLDDDMTWDKQPTEIDLTNLFSQSFKTTDVSQQIEFKGNIDQLVNQALKSSGSKKFIIRIVENVNNEGNKGLYYIAGNLFNEVEKRPVIDVQLRRRKTN